AFAGVYFRDGRPAIATDLHPALAASVALGFSPVVIHVDGPCGVGVACLPGSPDKADLPLMAIDRTSGVLLLLDGRLDDLERFAASLRDARGDKIASSHDAELALAAYLALGPGFVTALIGDFAFAVWDPRHERIICGRDATGIKPFYYAVTKDFFAFGSCPRSVLVHDAVPKGLNRGMLGEYLACAFCSQTETLYAGVQRLPPAHLMSVDRRQISLTRYWEIDPERRIRYRDPGDYKDHFLGLFRRAVADRMRLADPVGIALSGGLDSSAVAGMAQELLNEDGSGARLRAYSLTYPGEACDETPFIDAVVNRWDLISRRFPWSHFPTSPWRLQAAEYGDIPEYPSATGIASLYRGAASDGVRVLLTGEGGDYWYNGSSVPHRHMVAALDFGNLIRELRYEAGYTGHRNALRLLAGSLLWGLTPGTARRRIESRRRGRPLPPYLSPRFVSAISLEERLHCGDCAERFSDASQWQIVKHGRSGKLVHVYEMIGRAAASHGLELRHPLLDRRLIEFAVAVPDQLRRRGRIDRFLMREALAHLYPVAVRERRDKASFGIVMARALTMPQVEQVLVSPALLARPWIAPDHYRKFLDETLSQCRSGTGIAGPRQMFYLWMLFAVEVWYRETFGA
ncbi:MAG TPA: asparagine synthase-related protein, partial [Lamprocystis sp. (in: g-proteobacteria)]|nr:asparagine synthase-related protein [Lamprocystis sp. (in: g-proteobacteria)]